MTLFIGFYWEKRAKLMDTCLDLPSAEENKRLFDALVQSKEQIELAFGEPLDWERLDDRQACRIAIYRLGSIEDSAPALEEIRAWSIDHLLRFKQVLGPRLTELQKGKGVSPV